MVNSGQYTVYAYGSSEWMSGNFSLQVSDDIGWHAALDIILLPLPIKFTTHLTHEPVARHTHKYYEIMYMFSGSLVHYFDDEEITLNEGDCIMVAPGVHHAIGPCCSDDIGINNIIDKSFLAPDFLVLLPSCTPIIDFFSSKKDKIYLPGHGNAESAKVADLLISEFLNPDIASVCIIKCFTEVKHFFCMEQAKHLLASTEIPVRVFRNRLGTATFRFFTRCLPSIPGNLRQSIAVVTLQENPVCLK